MKVRKQRKKNVLVLLLVLLCSLSFGYALLTRNLTINGSSKIKNSAWDIHFANLVVNSNSVALSDGDAAAVINTTTRTDVTYTVTLNEPGDFYEFTVDAVNDGTIDGMIESVTSKLNDTVITTLPAYLDYSVTYNDGILLESNQLLKANSFETYKIRVEFRKNIDNNQLPSSDISLSFSFNVNYIQADNNGFERPFSLNGVMTKSGIMDNIQSTFVTGSNGVDFSNSSSDTNGRGIYIRKGTENDNYPIHYYRGEIEDNYVLFANYCWRMVRTTEKGGVRLVYNSEKKPKYEVESILDTSEYSYTNDSTYPYEYDETTKQWTNMINENGKSSTFVFSVNQSGDYIITYKLSYEILQLDDVTFYKNGEYIRTDDYNQEAFIVFDDLAPSDSITIKFYKANGEQAESNLVFSIGKKGNLTGYDCVFYEYNYAEEEEEYDFNERDNSLAFVGYMYGESYPISTGVGTNWYYAPDVEYENGQYTLTAKGNYGVQKKSSISGTNINYQHYTCGNGTDTSCTSVRYVYFVSGTTAYYITLFNGKKVEDAISEMLTNSSNSVDSFVKNLIDLWYQNHLINYEDFFEDTVYCNDRSIFSLGGWNPDGGSVGEHFYFGIEGRSTNPSLKCGSKNDSFTVSDVNLGNGKLDYPIGMLTTDEVILGGGKVGYYCTNVHKFPFSNGSDYRLLTPSALFRERVYGDVGGGGCTSHYSVSQDMEVRPAISLKYGTIITGGNGTATNPYTLE